MQGYRLPSENSVDEETMLRDVHRLIFDNTHTTAELLGHLGGSSLSSSGTPGHSAAKRVTISEEVTVFRDDPVELLNLPPALTLLYYAIIADSPPKNVPNLFYMLELLGEPAPPIAHGEVLYAEGMRHKEESAKWREEQKKALMEEELKECTFKPIISDSAKEFPSKGLATFMEKCVEWKKTAAMRLVKKAAQDRLNRGEDEWTVSWKMGDRSRKLLEEFEKKGKRRPKLWEPKSAQNTTAVVSSTSASARYALSDVMGQEEPDALGALSFHPVTKATVNEKLAWLKQIDDDDTMNTTNVSEKSDRSTGKLVEAYLQRFEVDMERRNKNIEKLRAHYAWVLKEDLYEQKTGRPLFEPNALPTVVKNGVHVSFDELSKEERRELMRQLRQNNQEHVLVRYFRSLRDARDGRPPNQRTIDELVDDLTQQTRKRSKQFEEFHSEETFSPQITVLAKKVASRRSWQPIYDRAIQKPALQSSVSSSPFTPKSKSSDVCMQRVVARSQDWIEQRNRRISEQRREMEQRLETECSFRPRLDGGVDVASVSGGSVHSRVVDHDALVANAEARMYNELGFLRSQAALRDTAFLGAVKHSPSSVTLATAPRPSRRSVEKYARNVSLAGSSRYSYTNSYGRYRLGYGSTAAADTYDDNIEDDDTSVDYSSYDDNYEDCVNADKDNAVTLDEVGDIANSWASLDAQTDLILKKCQYY